jgi:hypothetical protein
MDESVVPVPGELDQNTLRLIQSQPDCCQSNTLPSVADFKAILSADIRGKPGTAILWLATTVASATVRIGGFSNFAWQCKWSGALTGCPIRLESWPAVGMPATVHPFAMAPFHDVVCWNLDLPFAVGR